MTETATRSRASVHLELAEEVLRDFGELRFCASGGSMLPAIFPGDILLVRRESMSGVRRGDVVLSSHAGRFFAHRIVRIENRGGAVHLITRGDALRAEDRAVSEGDFLGRVTGLVRGRTEIDLGESLTLESRVVGWALRHSDFLAASLLRLHSLRLRFMRKGEAVAATNRMMAGESLR